MEIQEEETLGEKRCNYDFNTSSSDPVNKFRRIMADAIDYFKDYYDCGDFETQRCFIIAMEHIETAQMYGVKGIMKVL